MHSGDILVLRARNKHASQLIHTQIDNYRDCNTVQCKMDFILISTDYKLIFDVDSGASSAGITSKVANQFGQILVPIFAARKK